MTSRQFYIILWVIAVTLKVQRLPVLVYDKLGKDFYLIILFYAIVNIIGILLAFFVLNKIRNKSLSQKASFKFGQLLKSVVVLLCAFYFFTQALLLCESTQNIFEHILFDDLSWALFSLILIIAIAILAHTGIGNIALSYELYFYMILCSFIFISIFGFAKADFSSILPFQTIDINRILNEFVTFNIWFGDFFLVLFLGKHSKDIKLKWTLLVYILAITFVTLLWVEFGGIYESYSALKPSLITTITEQSLLDLNIGRIDWFLILFTQFGTILSIGVFVYFAKKCLQFVFPKVKGSILLLIVIIMLYIFNAFVLVDNFTRENLFMGIWADIAGVIKWMSFIFMVIVCLFIKNKSKTKLTRNIRVKKKEQSYEE